MMLLAWLARCPAEANTLVDPGCPQVYWQAAPADGRSDVSPDSVPAVFVSTCGAGKIDFDIDLEWSADDVPVDSGLHIDHAGIQWITELDLGPDTSYAFEASTNGSSARTAFVTGSDPLPQVTGAPRLAVTGFERAWGATTVGLDVALVPDPDSGLYEVRRDGSVVTFGVGDGANVDSFEGGRGDEVCYSLTQYLADSRVLGTSEDACVTVKGCSTTSAPASAPLAVAGLALLLRRRGATFAIGSTRRTRSGKVLVGSRGGISPC